MLGLRFCVRAFSSCGKWGPLFIAVRGPLTIVASLVVEHRLQARRLSSCGSRAQLLRGMWDLPRPGLEPVSPVLAGGFSTTAPPGKPPLAVFNTNCVYTHPLIQLIRLKIYWSKMSPLNNHPLLLLFFSFFGCTSRHEELPRQNPCPLQWKRRALTTGPPGKSSTTILGNLVLTHKHFKSLKFLSKKNSS